jgi:hypothetical protein
VDFGLGAPICDEASRSRRSWVFRMVLSYSRKAYSEALLRQDTETFLRQPHADRGFPAFRKPGATFIATVTSRWPAPFMKFPLN